MMEKKRYAMISMVLLLFLLVFFAGCVERGVKEVVYGISPYQDTALPIVAEKLNWYKQENLSVKIRLLSWDEVMGALASGAVDVAIQNFNSFQANYENIYRDGKGRNIIFYYPLYIFKGAAIVVRGQSDMKSVDEWLATYQGDREKAILATVKQLRGKKVIATKGTEMEQIVLSAISKAGLVEGKDVRIIHAEPADGLNAFLAGEGDAYSGGVTERTEAKRHGARELIEASDLAPPVVDGLVTTEEFAESHQEELLKLVNLWFRTINYVGSDLDNNSQIVIDYLAKQSSTRYSVEEYKYTWHYTQIYPKNASEIADLLLRPDSPYFWKKTWDANNEFLIKEKKIPKPVSHDAFWMERVQPQYISLFERK